MVGQAAILNLSGIAENSPISAEQLAIAGGRVRRGDILLLKTAWDERYPLSAKEFWTRAPYLTREACQWLLAQQPAMVGFDFPQDYPIRGLLDGATPLMEDFVSHDVLLRHGVPMIVEVCALPLKILDADGAPARVVAIERGEAAVLRASES
jgi:arylformamidase